MFLDDRRKLSSETGIRGMRLEEFMSKSAKTTGKVSPKDLMEVSRRIKMGQTLTRALMKASANLRKMRQTPKVIKAGAISYSCVALSVEQGIGFICNQDGSAGRGVCKGIVYSKASTKK